MLLADFVTWLILPFDDTDVWINAKDCGVDKFFMKLPSVREILVANDLDSGSVGEWSVRFFKMSFLEEDNEFRNFWVILSARKKYPKNSWW
jgi:hypothetical protein